MTLTWSDLNPLCIILYGWWAACQWWSVRSCCDKQKVRCRASLNLSHLRYSCQRCTLAVAQHYHANAWGGSIFRKYLNAHLNLRYMAASKHGRSVGCIRKRLRNAVLLVWGSLRLAPITCSCFAYHKWYSTRTPTQAQHGLCNTEPVLPMSLLPGTGQQWGGDESDGDKVLRQQGVQLPAFLGGATAIWGTRGQVPTENDATHS